MQVSGEGEGLAATLRMHSLIRKLEELLGGDLGAVGLSKRREFQGWGVPTHGYMQRGAKWSCLFYHLE